MTNPFLNRGSHIFCLSVSSRHSAEKRNPETRKPRNETGCTHWIPHFSPFLNRGSHIFCLSVSSRHSAEKRNPESRKPRNETGCTHWIPHFCGMTATDCLDYSRVAPFLNRDSHIFRLSVSSRHSAEKRNPETRKGCTHWIPHFCGMTTTDCLDCSRVGTWRGVA